MSFVCAFVSPLRWTRSWQNKVEIADRALSTTITMSISGDELVEKHAVCTLANLCEMVELHDKILKEEGLAPILSLAKSADIRTKGEACRALANLAANADIQKHLMCVRACLPACLPACMHACLPDGRTDGRTDLTC